MKDKIKTKAQLLEEMKLLRNQINDMETANTKGGGSLSRLVDSEIRYRRLFETAQDGILILDGNTGVIIDVNPFLVEMLGYSHGEFVGKRLWEIGPFKDIQASKIAYQELQQKNYVRYEHLPLETKDGRPISVEFVSNVYLVNHSRIIQCNIRDITQRKLEEEKSRTIIHTAMDGFWYVDNEGRFLDVNESYCRLTGYSRDELIHMSISDIECKETSEETFHHLQRLKKIGFDRFITCHRCKDGRIIDVEVSVNYLDIEGGRLFVFLRDITDRKKAEQQMAFQVKVWNNMHDAVIATDAAYNISAWNKAATDLYGWTAEEVIGRSSREILRTTITDIQLKELLEELSQKGNAAYETTQHHKEGRLIEIESKLVSFTDDMGTIIGYIAANRDITDRKKAEEALKQSELNYRTLVDSSPDAIVLLNQQGNILESNSALYDLLGYSKQQILGRHITRYIPGMTSSVFDSLYQQLIDQHIIEKELNISITDGSAIPFWVKIVGVFNSDRQLTQTIMYLRSVEKQKKLEQLRDEFISLVSHELRTPLTVIIGSLSTLLSEMSQLTQVEVEYLLKDAILEAENLSNLVGNFLELSRIQAKQLQLYIEPVNIRTLVENIVAKMKKQNPFYQFVIHIPDELQSIHADSTRVERIIYNLLGNAVRYSSQQSEIELTVKLEKEQIIFSVTDHGKGISAEEKAKLFGPFKNLDENRVDGIKGIGLGLLVCQRLVEAHGGRIWLESKMGQGSTFFFSLPALRDPLK